MRTIREEVQRVEVITKYEALDGKVFNSQEECEKYEQSAAGVINAEYIKQTGRLVSKDGCTLGGYFINYDMPFFCETCGDDDLYVFKPKSSEEVKAINMKIALETHRVIAPVTDEHIGKRIIVMFPYDYESRGFSNDVVVFDTEKILKDMDAYLEHKSLGDIQCKDCKWCNAESYCTNSASQHNVTKSWTASFRCFERKEEE